MGENVRDTQDETAVSVIMGVFNQFRFEELDLAIWSILTQTLKNLEFIIYNDGSDAVVGERLRRWARLDSRIRLVGQEKNQGLAYSLNQCIALARGKYIARMDADDISKENRLQIQYEYLESHPEMALVGCCAELIGQSGLWGFRDMPRYPEQPDFLAYSPYIHPTVMFRREVLERAGGYKVSRDTLRCEDYELFMRLMVMGYKGCNLPDRLFLYREDSKAYRRRTYASRIAEAKVRFQSFGELQVEFPARIAYTIKPLLIGLVPRGIMEQFKHNQNKLEVVNEER